MRHSKPVRLETAPPGWRKCLFISRIHHSTGKQNPNTDNAQLISATIGFGFSPRFQLMVQPFLVFFIRVYLHSFPKPTPLDIYYKRRLLKKKQMDAKKS